MLSREEIIQTALAKMLEEIRKNMEYSNKIASGQASDSLLYEFDDDSNISLMGVDYLPTLQTGMHPKRYPKGLAQRIITWAETKGITQSMTPAEVISFGHATAYKIVKYGSEQKRTGRYVDIYDTPLEDAAEGIADDLSTLRLNEILNMF